MDFTKTRTHEMLDSAAERGGKSKLIALTASTLQAHKAAIAMMVGPAILGERGTELRATFSLIAKILMAFTCETEDDIKTFRATEEAVLKDLEDLKTKHDH